MEELQEEGTVKGQSRGPSAQKRPRDEECLLSSQLSGLEDVVFNDFMNSFQMVMDKTSQVMYSFLTL